MAYAAQPIQKSSHIRFLPELAAVFDKMALKPDKVTFACPKCVFPVMICLPAGKLAKWL